MSDGLPTTAEVQSADDRKVSSPEALQLVIYIGYKKAGYRAAILAGVLFILPGYITLTALAWIYVGFGKSPNVLSVLWGFRPVGLALLLEPPRHLPPDARPRRQGEEGGGARVDVRAMVRSAPGRPRVREGG